MAEFTYRAVNMEGKAIHGILYARDEQTLEDKLLEDGFWLVKASAQEGQSSRKIGKIKLKRRDLIEFASGMAPMLEGGVSLMDALDEMRNAARSEDIGNLFLDIKLRVESGSSFHEALDAYPKAFPIYMRYLIRANEEIGNLGGAFVELERYLEWVEELAGQIKQASIYPLMVLLTTALFIMLLFTFVVPTFTKLLTSLDVALPLPTLIVAGLGEFMVSWWWVVILVPLISWGSIHFFRAKSAAFSVWFDKMKLSLPVFGHLNEMLVMSRFSHHFSILYGAGIPLLEVLTYVRDLVGNAFVAQSLDKIQKDISEGATISETMGNEGIFPSMLMRMIAVGENTGRLDDALSHVSKYYDVEIPKRIKRIFAIVEPAIILMLVAIVGGVALAIFLPMMSLMSAAK